MPDFVPKAGKSLIERTPGLKDKFTQKWQLRHADGKSGQGALQQRRVAAFSKTTEVAGDSFLNVENNQNENKMAPHSSSNDLEAQRSRADLKRGYLHTI